MRRTVALAVAFVVALISKSHAENMPALARDIPNTVSASGMWSCELYYDDATRQFRRDADILVIISLGRMLVVRNDDFGRQIERWVDFTKSEMDVNRTVDTANTGQSTKEWQSSGFVGKWTVKQVYYEGPLNSGDADWARVNEMGRGPRRLGFVRPDGQMVAIFHEVGKMAAARIQTKLHPGNKEFEKQLAALATEYEKRTSRETLKSGNGDVTDVFGLFGLKDEGITLMVGGVVALLILAPGIWLILAALGARKK